jgi:2-polyprenyl-3-methyl-5-hydroxy-6-metoxy-1,4-benzoquinol methylase
VVCLEVIEHVAEPGLLLERLRHSLRDFAHGPATLYLSTLNHNSQYRKNRGHVGKFCLHDFSDLVRTYFPGAVITDYTLTNELEEGSSITPMVAIWRS